jgi:hypothetical protein
VAFHFARERIHEVESVDLIPVVFTGFGGVYTGFEPQPGLNKRAYEAGQERNPVGAKPRGLAGIEVQSQRGRG